MFIAITFAHNQIGTVSITGDTSSTPWTSFGTVYSTTPNKYAFYKVADAGDAADSAAGGRSWALNCSDGFIEQWAGLRGAVSIPQVLSQQAQASTVQVQQPFHLPLKHLPEAVLCGWVSL
jgi:hypothetical protein